MPDQGRIELIVDATDSDRGIFRVEQTIPAPDVEWITLALAKWLPAYHAPRGSIDLVAGLRFEVAGAACHWLRDPADPFQFQVKLPNGARTLRVVFDALTPTEAAQGSVLVSDDILRLQWSGLALFPVEQAIDTIMIASAVRLPAGWEHASALVEEQRDPDGTLHFSPVDLRTLVDSPLLAGRNARRFALGRDVDLLVVADRADQLPVSDGVIEPHRRLIAEADALFERRAFDRYTFLMSLSDQISPTGLEHRASSEVGVRSTYFSDWEHSTTEHDLLPHEYVHSWVGKFRVPKGSLQRDFARMTDELMWVYEGLTQYYGHVLAARSGLISAELTRQAFALIFTTYDRRQGRNWRPLVDTDMDPIFTARRPQPWTSWQRSEDYYSEGLLIWLEADMLIRAGSAGEQSLDDFARLFFAPPIGGDAAPPCAAFTRRDVEQALATIHAADWEEFFTARIDRIAPRAPYAGITLGGYQLAWRRWPSDWLAHDQQHYSYFDFTYSVGFKVGIAARIIEVDWGGPAFRAGAVIGMKIVSVEGRAYSHAALQDAIDAAAKGDGAIQLIVRRFDRVKTLIVTCRDGQAYPTLERIGSDGDTPLLDRALAPRGDAGAHFA